MYSIRCGWVRGLETQTWLNGTQLSPSWGSCVGMPMWSNAFTASSFVLRGWAARGDLPWVSPASAARIPHRPTNVPRASMRMSMTAPQRSRDEASKGTARLRKAERKRQLLTHAKQLFVKHGYQDTTTEKIAGAAGVSEPVLYRHFESKKALFLEVLQEVRDATLNRWRAETANLTDP